MIPIHLQDQVARLESAGWVFHESFDESKCRSGYRVFANRGGGYKGPTRNKDFQWAGVSSWDSAWNHVVSDVESVEQGKK